MAVYIMGSIREQHSIERIIKKTVTIDGYIVKKGTGSGDVFGIPCYGILDCYDKLSETDIILTDRLLPTDGLRLDKEIAEKVNGLSIPLYESKVLFCFFQVLKYVSFVRWISEFMVFAICFRLIPKLFVKKVALKEMHYCKSKKLKMVIVGQGAIADYLIKRGGVSGWVFGKGTESDNSGIRLYSDYSELLYEKMDELFFYMVDSQLSVKSEGILLELGFLKSQIFGALDLDGTVYNSARVLELIDPLLGYNFIDDSLAGIDMFKSQSDYGDFIRQKKLKIFTLGGSTTDATLNNIKSWSEYLFEEITKRGFFCDVYCAGAAAYTVSQEFIKLVRDVLPMKPDVVISYSGVNDCYLDLYDAESPFVMNFQKDQASMLVKEIGCYNVFQRAPIVGVTTGTGWKGTNYEHWIRTERMMHALCENNGVKFYAFLQPHNNNLKYYVNSYDNSCKEEFYEKSRNIIRTSKEDWLIDISDLFDDKQNLFCDICHVYEMGNRIIARRIFSYVIKEIEARQKMALGNNG